MTVEELKTLSSNYDCLYFHKASWPAAKLSAGGAIDLTLGLLDGRIKNGMGILRPPGHHAMKNEGCGYCYINNVGLAARQALNRGVKKIAIVDWDVHHGQGTQREFYHDNRVLYISIHRFEEGFWWPNLKESDFTAIGEGEGAGFNVNIPLNVTGNNNTDYLAAWNRVVLPLLQEFSPELILVSAGYDAAVGCPEGEQNVTPACFAHFTRSLMEIPQVKLAAFLEGGYFLPSLAEGAALTLRTLLGDPVPQLLETLGTPNSTMLEAIRNVCSVLSRYWKCFGCYEDYTPTSTTWRGSDEDTKPPYDIMCPTPPRSIQEEEYFNNLVKQLVRETALQRYPVTVFTVQECKYPENIVFGKFQDGLKMFLEQQVQVLIGELRNTSLIQKQMLTGVKTAHIVVGDFDKQETEIEEANIYLDIAHVKPDDVYSVDLDENKLLLNCTDLLYNCTHLFQVLLPVLYRFNPQEIHIFLQRKEMTRKELEGFQLMLAQLKVFATGRCMVLVPSQFISHIQKIYFN